MKQRTANEPDCQHGNNRSTNQPFTAMATTTTTKQQIAKACVIYERPRLTTHKGAGGGGVATTGGRSHHLPLEAGEEESDEFDFG
ncbi:hypothetical protein TSUD_247590 [Trifolium subterraneum]|uniref:Uncharacterized protein n=1 Tax=Trifolium subterraneum TaxID=3900 RepID=A0A2Z6PET3_TRISU|nr:hypothetical protein TSUD_247590 [Trifolium subterraneum]